MKRTTVSLLVFLALAALALPLAADGAKGTWTGWITDNACGAKGAKAEHKDCATRCAKRGEKLVFYNNADQKLYGLDNQELALSNIGQEVKVTGEVDGTQIKVASIEPAGQGK